MAGIFYPNSGFYISGESLADTLSVNWGGLVVGRDSLVFLGEIGISGIVPAAAKTDIVYVVSSDGLATAIDAGGEQIVHLLQNHRIEVGSLSNPSGEIGGILPVTGNNFYNITDVKFGTANANFNVISPKRIEAFIPSAASFTGVTVYSLTASGEAGTSFNSGVSPNNFVPLPEVTSVDPGSQLPDEPVTVGGYSFAAVTGVMFPQGEVKKPISSLTDTSFSVQAPEGKARGRLTFLLQSGVSKQPISEYNSFSHLALVESISPSVCLAGASVNIIGKNFNTGILYHVGDSFIKASVGSVVSSGFKVMSDTLITGVIPESLSTGSKTVSLFSEIDSLYPSGKQVLISGRTPFISGYNPVFASTGNMVSLTGHSLLSIGRVTLTNADHTGRFVEITGSSIQSSPWGDVLGFSVPSGLQSGYVSGRGTFYVNTQVSGENRESNVLTSGLYVIGNPFIENVVSGTTRTREPGEEISLSGLNLLKSSKIKLSASSDGSSLGFVKPSSVSGSGNYVVRNYFNLPEKLNTTGIKAKLEGFNGESNFSAAIPVYKAPFINGFSPLSGAAGTEVTLDGYFSGLKGSGVKIAGLSGVGASQVSATGVTFRVPTGSSSDFITVLTSGGNEETSNRFSVTPDLPLETGFNPAPVFGLSYSVFGERQSFDILGTDLNFVTEVKFYDDTLSDISVTTFKSKSDNRISLFLPQDVEKDEKGTVRLVDRFGRVRSGVSEFRVAQFSGASGMYGAFGEELSFSGKFLSGLNVVFKDESEVRISGEKTSSIKYSETGFAFNSKVPRDVTSGNLIIRGVENDLITLPDVFFPLPTITGVSGHDSYNLNVGSGIRVTGINSFGPYKSGESVIGITGAGKHAFFAINNFERIVSGDNQKVSVFDLDVGGVFTGSGQLFVMSPWENYDSMAFDFPSSKTSENLSRIVTDNYYTMVYPVPSILGVANTDIAYSSDPTGRKFNERVSGWISGDNLASVTGVFFSGYTGAPELQGAAGFTALSNSLIQFAPPFGSYGAIGWEGITGSGDIIVKAPQGDATTAEMSQSGAFLIPPLSVDVFLPQEGITGTVINLHDHITPEGTLGHLSKISFEAENYTGEANATVYSSIYATTTVPTLSLLEGRDITLRAHGLLTDQVIVNNTGVGLVDVDDAILSYRPYKFRVIPDTPAIQFNVLSGRGAPETGPSRSSMFTIVQNIGGTDYYVTKIINPDGKEIIMNTEQV